MRDVLVLSAAGIGGILLAFGNDWGFVGLVPVLLMLFQDAKKV